MCSMEIQLICALLLGTASSTLGFKLEHVQLGDIKALPDKLHALWHGRFTDEKDFEVTGPEAIRKNVASCTCSGDPHCSMYGGSMVHFQGSCSYVLSRDKCIAGLPSPDDTYTFQITAKFYRRNPNKTATWVHSAHIHLPEKNMNIWLKPDLSVDVNGVTQNLPRGYDESLVYIGSTPSNVYISVEDMGLMVRWKPRVIEIIVPTFLNNTLCGLCGSLDDGGQKIVGPGDKCISDLNVRERAPGEVTLQDILFGTSWLHELDEDPTCQQDCKVPPEPSRCPPDVQMEAQDQCMFLHNPTGKFGDCLSVIPKAVRDEFYVSCVLDLCLVDEEHDISLCTQAEELAHMCLVKYGIIVKEWRDPEFCGITCPNDSHYSSCADPCNKRVCPIGSADACISVDACEEGCVCDDGFYWSNDLKICVTTCDSSTSPDTPTMPSTTMPATTPNGDNDAGETCPTGGVWCLTCQNAPSEAACNLKGKWESCPMDNPVCEVTTLLSNRGAVMRFSRVCKTRETCQKRSEGPASKQCRMTGEPEVPVQLPQEEIPVQLPQEEIPVQLPQEEIPVQLPKNPIKSPKPVQEQVDEYFFKRGAAELTEGVWDFDICSTCEEGKCDVDCPPNEPLHCFSCHARSDIVCWISGRYRECTPDSMCYYKRQTLLSGRTAIWRGCMLKDDCPLVSNEGEVAECEGGDDCLVCDNGGANPASPEKAISMCGEPAYGTCSCKGDPHCVTFDGIPIQQLPGSCWHSFARDGCDGSLPSQKPTFTVSIKLEYLTDTKVAVQSVFVSYGNMFVILGQNPYSMILNDENVDIGNATESYPYIATSGLSVAHTTTSALRILLPNDVVIEWDCDREIQVSVPNSFRHNMCGICGDFNNSPDGDFTYGPTDDAAKQCPNMTPDFDGVKSGNKASQEGEQLFVYTWIDKVAQKDGKCLDDCTRT